VRTTFLKKHFEHKSLLFNVSDEMPV